MQADGFYLPGLNCTYLSLIFPEPDPAAPSYTAGKTYKKDQRNALPEMGGQRLGTFLSDDQICKESFQSVPHGQRPQGQSGGPLKTICQKR